MVIICMKGVDSFCRHSRCREFHVHAQCDPQAAHTASAPEATTCASRTRRRQRTAAGQGRQLADSSRIRLRSPVWVHWVPSCAAITRSSATTSAAAALRLGGRRHVVRAPGCAISKPSSLRPASIASRCSACRRARRWRSLMRSRIPNGSRTWCCSAASRAAARARADGAVGREEAEMMRKLAEIGWGQENPAFRQFFTSQFIPGGNAEQHRWFNELARMSTSPRERRAPHARVRRDRRHRPAAAGAMPDARAPRRPRRARAVRRRPSARRRHSRCALRAARERQPRIARR